MRLTIDDIEEHLPVNVYDANGMVILRAITAFDPQTGEVESYVYTPDGALVEEPPGEVKTRVETYPAPLHWRKITQGQADNERRNAWDLEGR